MLRDTGLSADERARLAALPFAVTFAIDPMAADAAEAARAYRAAGQEVVMLATGIPDGATAADLEQTFGAHQAVLPEAVAVMDPGTGALQGNRGRAALALPIVAAQGRALVTFDRGLNAAEQVARREGLPSAVVFRDLDGAGESRPTIRRYLDRAVFRAAQEGSTLVTGTTAPETVAALLEWTVEGRASLVTLAPLTAVLQRR